MNIGALKFAIFASFVALLGWKVVRGLVSTETVVQERVYGVVATKPIRAGVTAITTAAVSFGGYLFAELSYLWLAVAIVNLFVAFLIFGQSQVHDRAAAMDAELALGIRNGPRNLDSRLSDFCPSDYAASGNMISPKYA